jgi:hypothetical protein
VYILGGACTGKSTLTGQLLDLLPELGPLEDLWRVKNSRGSWVTLRGHYLGDPDGPSEDGYEYRDLDQLGLYLGMMRDQFPGTDGLDRVSGLPGEIWLQRGRLPGYLVAEGATLATKRFLAALHECTDLLLVHLWTTEDVKAARFVERGSNQDPKFVRATETRAKNRTEEMRELGTRILAFNSDDPDAWDVGLDMAAEHLSSRARHRARRQ